MSQLPRLPVPDIRKTLDAYLRSVQPILLADEHSGGPPFAVAYARQRALVNAFLDGPGRRAQARLRALDSVSPHNWLDDNFWTKKTYLEWRAPLLINSNWWLAFVNDPNVPREVIANHVEGITPWQVRRAACLVHGILDFKHRIHSCVSSPFPLLPLTFATEQPGPLSRRHSDRYYCVFLPHLTSAHMPPARYLAKTLHFPNIQPLSCPSASF